MSRKIIFFIMKYGVFLLPIPVIIAIFIINKLRSKTMIQKLIPFIQKQEGGLSRDPADNASANPCPYPYNGKTGYHTNMGVTWTTFTGLASKLGYQPTANNFFKMSFKIWFDILNHGYMRPYNLDSISNLPRIQAVIITWAWGSGVTGAEMRLARWQREYFKINDSNITPLEITANFKKHVNSLNEKIIFNQLCDRRAEDFSKMADFPKYKNGWLNRLSEFRKLFN
jgi:lysozyme family protein